MLNLTLSRFLRNVLFTILLSVNCLNIFSQSDSTSTTTSTEEEFISQFNKVMAQDKYVEKLDSASFYNLPLGILGGNNDDPNYAILIDEVVLYPEKATFSASMVLTNPFDSSKMVFVAEEVPFTFNGGIQGTIRLELVSEKPVTICDDIGLEIMSGSYVEANCEGFQSLHIKGKFELNEDKYILSTADTNSANKKVTSYFEATVQDWNDLSFSLSVDPFYLKNYPDFIFQCDDLAVDFSDTKNPSTLVFPDGYSSAYPAETIELWRGVYIKNAKVILNGEKFQKKNSSDQLAFGVENLIIDELGFSGKVYAENLLSLEEGSLAGWNFSIDRLELEFETSSLTEGGLEGQMHIPVFDDSTNFNYDAYVDVKGNYGFTVSPDDTLSLTLFGKSTLDLYETSYINITSDSNGFVPTACFNGEMTINGKISSSESSSNSKSDAKLKMADIEFQNFKVSTAEPKIDIGYMAYHGSGTSKLSKFPITISDIVFESTASSAKLSISAAVNLKKDSDEGFSGSTTLSLLATRNDYSYKFNGVEVDAIAISVEKPNAYKIDGSIAFARGDSIYGDGFKGSLEATFAGDFELDAEALFGNVDGYRYFYVDGMFAMKPGIQAGPITIFGFGGGLYHHMRQRPNETDSKYDFGLTSSGLVYAPNNNIALGIKAGVVFGVGSEQAVNAETEFEIAFTNSGGVSFVSFTGEAQCITPPISIDADKMKTLTGDAVSDNSSSSSSSSAPSSGGAIAAKISMYKDFENDEFHADMSMYVNLSGIITGVGSNNCAGSAVIHSSPDLWYMYIGTPTEPLGLDFLGLAQLKSYFMAGQKLPSSMPLNAQVSRILGITEEDVAAERDESELSAGSGIAFGASFDVSTGDKTFLQFYGNFSLGAGFDVLLGDYGEDAYCEGSAPPLGINGWYATGQAYAYFTGTIGLEATVFRKKKKFEIFSIATAAYLKAEAPNPVWLLGYAGGNYSVLGGMIKGSCKFEVEVGERCTIRGATASSALANLTLISDITPEDNEDDVDVFTTPQVVFNVPVNKQQKLSEDDGSTIYFRINLDKLTMYQGDEAVPFDFEWNTSKDIVRITPGYVLYPNTDYTITAQISFEQKVDGVWEAFVEDGDTLTEEKTVTFTTGELPGEIPASEVAYSYPIDRQFNFLQDEYNKAYLIFYRDLQAFFAASEDYEQMARWTTGSTEVYTDINYSTDEKTLYFDLPGSLALSSIYSLELVSIPSEESSNIEGNVSETESEESIGDSSTVTITTQQAEGTITNSEEKVMYNLDFRTSKYTSFNSRFSSTNITARALYDAGYMEFYIFLDLPGGEPFDIYERPRTNDTSLIRIEMDLKNTPWFNDYVYPMVYEQYPWYKNYAITWRDTTRYGLTAKRALGVNQPSAFTCLTDDQIAAGYASNNLSFSDLYLMQPFYWDEDYMQIRDELAYYYELHDVTETTLATTILGTIKLRPVKPGDYPIILKYVLPGKNTVTSKKTITVTSTFKTSADDF